MSEFEYPPKLGWCTKHGNTTVCKDCLIEKQKTEIDRLQKDNIRYRMALETIATETIEPSYSTKIAMRWRMIAREAVGDVLGE